MKNRLRSASPIFSTFPFRLPEIELDCPKRRGSAPLKEAFMGARVCPDQECAFTVTITKIGAPD